MKQFLVILIAVSLVESLHGLRRKPHHSIREYHHYSGDVVDREKKSNEEENLSKEESDVSSEESYAGYLPEEEDWGFYEVRRGAFLFYWLFYAYADSVYDRPLVIWLGGDESSSLVNFNEIGPIFVNDTYRRSSWDYHVNLMFIDSLLGSGYSYAKYYDDSYEELWTTLLPTDNQQVGADVVTALIKFYEEHPDFSTVPMYIFGESYAGAIAVEVAKQLDAAIKENKLLADFRGIGLQNPSISPIDMCSTWASYLLNMGLVDQKGHDDIAKHAQLVQEAYKESDYKTAAKRFDSLIKDNIQEKIGKIFTYNILDHKETYESLYFQVRNLMNNDVAEALFKNPESVGFDRHIQTAVNELQNYFIKSETSVVEELLNNTNLKVVVYNGQLDIMVNPLATLKWIDRLQWSGSSGWHKAEMEPFVVNKTVEGFVKNHKNLFFYSIERAGNKVAKDNPEAATEILRRLTHFDKK